MSVFQLFFGVFSPKNSIKCPYFVQMIPRAEGHFRANKRCVVILRMQSMRWECRCTGISFEILVLCEIQWVIEFQFPTQKVNHMDKVAKISEAPSATFCQLNFAVDAFEDTVG
jgi:hypothetical protein